MPALATSEILGILKGIPPAELEPGRVRRLLEGVHAERRSLERYLHFRPGSYTRNLIFRSERFELLALCWDRGTRSPIHSHSGQDCWFLVQEGEFCLQGFRILRGGLEPGAAELEGAESRHQVGAGALDHRGPLNDIHRVTVSRGCARAISLHVYARPLDDCLVYDLERKRCRRQRLGYDSVEGRPV